LKNLRLIFFAGMQKQVISTVEARGQVEKWLLQLEKAMISSIRNICMEGLESYGGAVRKEWVQKWPGQVWMLLP
jgi:dynein heavy chain